MEIDTMISRIERQLKLAIDRSIHARYGLILTYHSVITELLEFNMWTHMLEAVFEQQMRLLAETAEVVPLGELIRQIRRGRLRRHQVAITFDDGFRNNLTRAYPILKRYGIPATIFLATGHIGSSRLFWPERVAYQFMRTERTDLQIEGLGVLRLDSPISKQASYRALTQHLKLLPQDQLLTAVDQLERILGAPYIASDPLYEEFRPLTWEDVHDLERGGLISFGGHTVDHAILARLTESQSRQQIIRCKAALDQHLTSKERTWAYPNGSETDFSQMHRMQLLDSGFFDGILTMVPEFVSPNSNVSQLGRMGIGSDMSIEQLQDLLCKRDLRYQKRGLSQLTQAFRDLAYSIVPAFGPRKACGTEREIRQAAGN